MLAILELYHTNPWSAFQLLLAFLIGHALCDFPLQGEYLANGKNWRFLKHLQDPSRPPQIWVACMSAHCLIHTGAVWIITGSPLIAVAEFVLHWCIDVAKCRGMTTFNQDQSLHVLCKVAYVGVWCFGLV
jgi:hypothetical protein